MARKGMVLGIAGLALSASAIAHVASASSSESASARASRPQVTTIQTIRGRIYGFARDGRYVAWVSRLCTTSCSRGVVIRRLGTRTQGSFRDADIGSGLVLAGPRAFWVDYYCGNYCYTALVAATLGDRRAHLIDELGYGSNWGSEISDLVADGDTQLYGTLDIGSCWDPNDDDEDGSGGDLVGGSIVVLEGETYSRFLGLPAARLALKAGRVAAFPPPGLGCLGNSTPAWSPDGSLIAFTHSGGGDGNNAAELSVDVVSSTGGERRTVATGGVRPAWSPNSSTLAFVTAGGSIAAVNADGTGMRTILSCSGRCDSPAWAPDASKLAFARGGDLFTVKADGSGETRLTQTPHAYESDPVWSPDGSTIAFTAWVGRTRWPAIYTIDSGGGTARRLTDGSSPSFSPGGQRIAFVKQRKLTSEEIYVMRSDGTAARRLTHNVSNEEGPAWSPNGRRLVFASDFSGEQDLYVMKPDGSAKTGVTDDRLPIEVHSVADGALLSRFLPQGQVLAMAVTRQTVAVLVKRWNERVIVLFDPDSGASRGLVQVPQSVGWISAATRTVAFSAGRRIWALDTVSLRRTLLAVAASRPIGVSIEGRRVTWAESGKRRSYIRAASLP